MTTLRQGSPEFAATASFMRQASIPLIRDRPTPAVEGAGFLFKRGGQYFLITAAHVAELLRHDVLGAPVGDGGQIWNFGKGQLAWADAEDVAAMRIDEATTIGRLEKAGYRLVLDDSNVLSGTGRNAFWLYGFPTRLQDGSVAAKGENVEPEPVLISTSTYEGPTDHVHTEAMPRVYDLNLKFPDRDTDIRGISGSPVWCEVDADDAGLWDPRTRFKLAAVQTAVVRGSWIRSTQWRYVDRVVNALL